MLLAIAGFLPPPAAAAPAGPRPWLKPPAVEGRVFPVLRSAERRWLNWRDTFGAPRMRLQPDGVWRQVGMHEGIDIFTEEHAPIVSMTRGRVERAGWTFYSGWRVGIRGSDGKYYFYAHLSSFAPRLAEGLEVVAGQVIGRVGNSGYGSEGTADEFPPHLHLGVQNGSEWENPQAHLEKLYSAYVLSTRAAEDRVSALKRLVRSLRGRAYAPSAPPPEVLMRRIAELEGKAAEVTRDMLLEV